MTRLSLEYLKSGNRWARWITGGIYYIFENYLNVTIPLCWLVLFVVFIYVYFVISKLINQRFNKCISISRAVRIKAIIWFN